METRYLFVVLALASAFAAAACGASALAGYLGQRQNAYLAQRQAGPSSAFARVLRRGVVPLFGLARMLLGIPAFARGCENVCLSLAEGGRFAEPHAVASLLAGACVLVLGVSLPAGALPVAVLACVAGTGALFAWASQWAARRRQQMQEGLPDALRSMASCFHAGLSLGQTFDQLAHESKGPLRPLFAQVLAHMQSGRSAVQALSFLQRQGGPAELSFLAVALQVQHETGGAMQHVPDSVGDALRSEVELRRALRVHTAQARLSARVVSGVSIALVGALALLSPGFLDPFFESFAGVALLALACGMQLAGIVAVRRLLKVSVV